MGNQKDAEWPENRAFSSLAPLAGDTELTERGSTGGIPAKTRASSHHKETFKPWALASFPGRYGGNSEPGVTDLHSPAGSFLLAL